MAKKEESKELVVQEEPGALEVMSQEDLEMLAGLSGMGLEKATTADMALPFLSILQAQSPEAIKRGAEYVEGAEAGMIFNTITKALYNELVFIPSAYVTRYTEWKPRDQGGGLVRDHGEDSTLYDKCSRDERNKVVTPAGTNIVKSATFFGQIYPTQERAVLAFSSTQLKKGRQWVTMSMNQKLKDPKTGMMVTPPLFFMSYLLTSVPESNDKGDWFGWSIKPHKPCLMLPDGRSLFNEAKRLAMDVTAKKVEVKVDQLAGEAKANDQIPF